MKTLEEIKQLCKNLTVLYVEDEEDIRRTFERYLKRFFDNVTTCENGEEGLETYKRSNFDLILTDIQMPKMDGLTMFKHIKEINELQNIIIISAYSETEIFIESIKLGVDGYILKPIDFNQINQLLYKISTKIQKFKENENYKQNLEKMVAEKTKKIREQYITDEKSGLFNRNYFNEVMQQPGDKTFLLLNINHFSIINDNYGYEIADRVLLECMSNLIQLNTDESILFRISGDEFGFLYLEKNEEKAHELANKIYHHFNQSRIVVENINFNISFSMGIDTGNHKQHLRNCSLAIRQLRNLEKGWLKVYENNSIYENNQKENIYWIGKIKETLYTENFIPYFQPIVDIKTKSIYKYECLARIIDNKEIILPVSFIGPAHIDGLVPEITKIMIMKSFKEIANSNKHISINIVNQDLKLGYLLEFLEYQRKQHNLNASQISLEIVESMSLDDFSIEQLKKIKEFDYKISIDDFGTENSNFSRLLNLEVDFIKIDGSFIKNIDKDIKSERIVTSIVSFAHNIGAKVIVEFVHNESIYKKVEELNVDYAQGYFFAKPEKNIQLTNSLHE